MLCLQRIDDDHLMLWRNPRKDGNILDSGRERVNGHRVQILSGQNRFGSGQPQILGDGDSRQGMVASNHNRANAGLLA